MALGDTTRQCSVDGCSRPERCRKYCQRHYDRWRTTGAVGPAMIQSRQSSGRSCCEPDCDNPVGRSGGHGWCGKHYLRWKTHGDPRRLAYAQGNGLSGEAHPRWVGEDISYAGVHLRLRRERGAVSARICDHCGERAANWAYDHTDTYERCGIWGGSELTYSTDLDRYLPLCVSCHRRFDRAHHGKV